MFWLIAAVVVVALAALVWWTSGRAKPLSRHQEQGPHLEAGSAQARVELHRKINGNLGPE